MVLEGLKEAIVEERICTYLMTLKITPNLKGYAYFKECAMRIYIDTDKKFNIHSNLFNELALQFNEKQELIERSLRHAIMVSIKREGLKDFERITKYEFCSSRPSLRELLCVIVECASIECKKMMVNNCQNLLEKWNRNLIEYQVQ